MELSAHIYNRAMNVGARPQLSPSNLADFKYHGPNLPWYHLAFFFVACVSRFFFGLRQCVHPEIGTGKRTSLRNGLRNRVFLKNILIIICKRETMYFTKYDATVG